jgi:hypothetical protein
MVTACYTDGMKDPDRWTLKKILRTVGWLLVFLALIMIFPMVGGGTGESHEPGSDTIRLLSLDNVVGVVMIGAAVVGVILLIVASVIPEDDWGRSIRFVGAGSRILRARRTWCTRMFRPRCQERASHLRTGVPVLARY